ncbi:MAG: hypothetical protein ACRCUE_08150 [Bosea sp. (in: a-proteobacteria)]
MNTQVSEGAVVGNHHDGDYDALLSRVHARFLANCADGAKPLFTTNAEGLWGAYLDTSTDPTERQYRNCHACRQFVERFGALATIGDDGTVAPAIWHEDDAPDAYRPALAAMSKAVRRAKVTGVFLSSDAVWGTPETGVWHHLAVRPAASMVLKRATQTAGQAMAEKREDFKTVMRALNEFTQPHLETALTLLKTDALYRSEKVLGQAEWLHGLHVARAAAHGAGKANAVWRAIATAPAGFCHPRSSMIGTLLEDIAASKDFGDVSRAFAAKMHPLAYQRPQAAPTAGAIAAAEKVMQQLGAASALARRFARLDEVQALWRPTQKKDEAPSGGVFGHLKPKGDAAPSMSIPAQTMTWEKFQREVLPAAERIEFQAPSLGSYTSLVTAANADAPPILQWDSEGARNPVSWYFWHGGSTAAQFGLTGGKFHQVNAVALKPSMWNGGHEHQDQGMLFVIDGAKDSRTPSACLFPEILKAEFHGMRSVLEAYSKVAQVEGAADQSAAGVMLQEGHPWDATVRVWSGGKSLDYRLDRWD